MLMLVPLALGRALLAHPRAQLEQFAQDEIVVAIPAQPWHIFAQYIR